MPSHKTKPPLYPKSHIVAASGIAAALSIFLLVIPTSDVEARKTYVQLDLDTITAHLDSAGSSKDLDALISETVTFSLADELNRPTIPLAAKPSLRGRDYQALPVELPMAIVAEAQPASEWKSVTVASGDTLSVVFNRVGLSANTLHAVINSSSEAKRFTRLKAGQVLDFKLGTNGELNAMKSKINDLETLRLDRDGDSYIANNELITPDVRTQFAQGEITSSLFLAAQKAGMSHNLTMEMANIFGYDVDFARDIRQGDRFEVIYEELHVGDKRVGTNNILAARFSNRGKTYTAVRYTDKSGYSSYYRADGTSLRKAFIRTPVEFARISSKFNPNRRHPVLNKIRAHNGVDYAAATGTPIKATGDGRIVHVGRKGGYGNTIIVQHGQKYKTLYAHMSRYANNMRQGTNVSQGQIIGYVGMTGLATGPHLHYEFLVNGRHVNPLGIDLPVADPVPQNERTAFMAISNKMMASLDQSNETQVALLEQ
ncbi:OapA family protein [Halopseudomonas pelagia]|uniref:OapA family protein n=1 Tax=Halopseudomonas pelagia TaxID=553151 RepID=UPI00039F529D|nr:peptidoglycan DD-metalloendopeptidase family protein [Halopseudomonas pelagia]|tara:strand:- start:59118 stop:60572 length:1455 start_codon:yes stop_codon:yes gene_type:complete